jgi:DNA-directed RNA polymerase specialized sigma24 family protein
MPEIKPGTDSDAAFLRACAGDRDAFADWMGAVEAPIRRSLSRFARAVDVESVMQETLLRMWLYAQDRGRELEGPAASLRFAIGMARNVARSEARRMGRISFLPAEELPDVEVEPEPPPDPGLRKAIMDCLGRLRGKPLAALKARLGPAVAADRELAQRVGMTLNTFLQNIVRARKSVAECLRQRGIVLEEVLP